MFGINELKQELGNISVKIHAIQGRINGVWDVLSSHSTQIESLKKEIGKLDYYKQSVLNMQNSVDEIGNLQYELNRSIKELKSDVKANDYSTSGMFDMLLEYLGVEVQYTEESVKLVPIKKKKK